MGCYNDDIVKINGAKQTKFDKIFFFFWYMEWYIQYYIRKVQDHHEKQTKFDHQSIAHMNVKFGKGQ